MNKITYLSRDEHLADNGCMVFLIEDELGRERTIGIDTDGKTGRALYSHILKHLGRDYLEAAKEAGAVSWYSR